MASERTGIASSRTARDGGGQTGGGTFPGYGGVPPAVSPSAGSAGTATTLSRSDHTHLLAPDAAPGVAGSMSANDATKVFETPSDPWAANVQAIMWSAVPGLTYFKVLPNPGASGVPLLGTGAGAPAALPTGAADAAVEGGGISVSVEARWTWATIFQLTKTGKGAVAFRGALPAIAVGKYGHMGISNVARSHFGWIVWTNRSVSTTKFALSIVGAAITSQPTISVADTAIHDFIICFDGTLATPTLWLYIDDVLEATITTLTQLSDEPQYIESGTNDDGTTAVVIERIAYAAAA